MSSAKWRPFCLGLNELISISTHVTMDVSWTCFHLSKVLYKHCSIHSLQWCHNERDGFSDYRHLYCLLNRLFRRGSKKASKLRVTGLCEGNHPVTGGFLSQRISNTENVSIWCRHHIIFDPSDTCPLALVVEWRNETIFVL